MFHHLLKSLCSKLIRFPAYHPIWWRIISSLFQSIPLIIYTYIAYNYTQSANKSSNTPLLHTVLKNFFESYKYGVLLLIAVSYLINMFLSIYHDYAKHLQGLDIGDNRHLSTVLSSIDNIIGKKLVRFGDNAHKIIIENKKNGITQSCEEVFKNITQPIIQIREIVDQLSYTLNIIKPEATNMKIVLISVGEDNTPKEFIRYNPLVDRPSKEILIASDSFFKYVANKPSFAYIKDLGQIFTKNNKHRKKYPSYHVSNGKRPKGSIIGFPIINNYLNDKLSYICTIKSDIPNIITPEFYHSIQNSILNHYINRIKLENHLQEIKYNVINEQ